jgi:phage gpG-like protein
MGGVTGDWQKLERMLSDVGNKFKANVGKATARAGSIMVAAIVARIEKKLSPGLSKKYERAKAKAGYAVPGLLIRDSDLVKRGIKSKQLDWQSGMVTVMRNVAGKGGLVNIGAIHEFGSPKMKIPARPFALPGAKDAEPNVVKEYDQAVEDTFK